MSRRPKKRTPHGRPARDPSIVARSAVGKLPGGRAYSFVVPFVSDIDAADCYAMATTLAQLAKEFVEAGDTKNGGANPLILHCWEEGPRHARCDADGMPIEEVGSTCMLPDGHAGPHEWTSDEEIRLAVRPNALDVWAHPDGTAHSATGPLGCLPCANERRRAADSSCDPGGERGR